MFCIVMLYVAGVVLGCEMLPNIGRFGQYRNKMYPTRPDKIN